MPTYTCYFQHPQTGHGCEATYAFGKVIFRVDPADDYLDEGWSGDADKLRQVEEETRALVEKTLGTAKPIRAKTLEEANQIVHSVAREQFDYGLEET